MTRSSTWGWLFCGLVAASITTATADDVYCVQRLTDVDIQGLRPDAARVDRWSWRNSAPARVLLDGEGEAFVARIGSQAPAETRRELEGLVLAVRLNEARDFKGSVVLATAWNEAPKAYEFKLEKADFEEGTRRNFLWVKQNHYLGLLNRDIPGSAWYRHQLRLTNKELGVAETDVGRRRQFFGTSRSSEMEDTYALISGGRAVSENLQLDRMLPIAKAEAPTVAIDSLKGITVAEFDWEQLVADIDPKLDPLAKLIPADQHALFFPSFRAMVQVAENATEQSAPILSFAEPKSESANVRERYERQLGLSLNTAAKLVGPQVIGSVAMTGGDPYFRTGTDVAVLFEAKTDPAALLLAIDTQIALNTKRDPNAKTSEGKLGDVTYTGRRSFDRTTSSYVARIGDAVVVTNSLAQLRRIAETSKDESTSLKSLDEFRFFRERYKLGDKAESGLLVISDATIRRWCGAKWRIGTSRRTRAVALMAETQSQHLDDLVGGKVQRMEVEPVRALPDAGKFTVTTDGVMSEVYGSLEFQTPISELDLDLVTRDESQFYVRWRDGYQRNWSNFFDPIAVRFSMSQERLAADMTVMPLISASRYQTFVDMSKGAKINPAASDRHADILAQWTLAISRESLSEDFGTLVQGMLKVNPFSWMGETFTMYMDQDEFWKDLAAVDADRRDAFLEENVHRLPIGLTAEVSNGFKLTVFLTAVRTFVEQTAPDMTKWETKRYKERAYVRVSFSDSGREQVPEEAQKLALFYAASGQQLVVTLSESVLHRAIDRQLSGDKAREDAVAVAEKPALQPLLGESMCVQVDQSLLALIKAAATPEYQSAMQRRAFANLPILNEWKQRYPDQDPVAVHEEFWQRRLLCPGGGKYVWNEEWQTMESTVYGHPATKKNGPPFPAAFDDFTFGNFGLTFEHDGLRAKIALDRKQE